MLVLPTYVSQQSSFINSMMDFFIMDHLGGVFSLPGIGRAHDRIGVRRPNDYLIIIYIDMITPYIQICIHIDIY